MRADVKLELKEMRNLHRRGIVNSLTSKYKSIFTQLPPLEEKVMFECYIAGKSFLSCGVKIGYCERQIRRIVKKSFELIENILREQ